MTVEKVISESIINVVDKISDVVQSVRDEYDVVNGITPIYDHGNLLEIVNNLTEKSSSGELKYPLVALLEDFPDQGAFSVFKNRAKVDILIMTLADPDHKADQRYTDSFDLILTPILNLFLKHFKNTRGIFIQNNSVKTDSILNHLYWGKNKANIFNDYIDAIEIRGLDLKIYR